MKDAPLRSGLQLLPAETGTTQGSFDVAISRAIRGECPGLSVRDAWLAARAAIRTMRNPTPAMLDAGARVLPPPHAANPSIDAIERVWYAMIDAAFFVDRSSTTKAGPAPR